jgi:hypothetical protein
MKGMSHSRTVHEQTSYSQGKPDGSSYIHYELDAPEARGSANECVSTITLIGMPGYTCRTAKEEDSVAGAKASADVSTILI